MGIVLAIGAIVTFAGVLGYVIDWLDRHVATYDPWPDFGDDDVIEPAHLPLSESDAACRIRAEILASEASRYLREVA